MAAKKLEELEDVMEVLFGLAEDLGYSEEELMRVREEKKEEDLMKGLFWRGFYRD